LAASSTAGAQEEGSGSPFFPNFLYSTQIGIGVYEKGELTVRVLRIPLSYRFGADEERRVTWRLRFPVILGRYRLESGLRTSGLSPTELELDAVSFLPGVEADVRLRSNWRLRPSASLGYGHDLSGAGSAILYSGGVSSRAWWERGKTTITLGNALTAGGNSGTPGHGSDSYASLDLGVEVRRAIGLRMAGEEVDLGLFAISYLFLGDLEVARFLQESLVAANLYEVGFSIGTIEKAKLWKLGVPRLGLAYRFGSGVRGLSLTFGFPF